MATPHSAVDTAAVEQAETNQARRESTQTAVERFAAEAEMVYSARTAATLDRLTADGALTADQRSAFAADPSAMGSLSRLLRTAELAGHDPDHVLCLAIADRDFAGARSLPQVVYGRIEHQFVGQLAPTATTYADMNPAMTSASWREQLGARAAEADDRRNELSARTAADVPQWAAEALGTVPVEPVAGWSGNTAPVPSQHGGSWPATLTQPMPSVRRRRRVSPSTTPPGARPGRLSASPRRPAPTLSCPTDSCAYESRRWPREEAWAPAYVGESLTATSLAAQSRRRDAVLTAARAEADSDPVVAARLRQQAKDDAAVADALDAQVEQLNEADQARARWLAHTAVTRDAAEPARAELAARGVAPDADEEAVTAEEWLAAHRAEQAESDAHRHVTDAHDLAEVDGQRADDVAAATDPAAAAETAMPDVRQTAVEDVADVPGGSCSSPSSHASACQTPPAYSRSISASFGASETYPSRS